MRTFRGIRGEDGAVGTRAGSMVSIRTRLGADPDGFSSWLTTTSAKLVPTELAMAAARAGSEFEVDTEITTEFVGEVASMDFASSCGVVFRFNSSITRSSTTALSTTSTKLTTAWRAKFVPCASSVTPEESDRTDT